MNLRSQNRNGILLIAVLAVSIFVANEPTQAVRSHSPVVLKDFPRTLGAWTSEEGHFSDDILATLGAKDYLVRQYQLGTRKIALYITYFDTGSGALTHNPEKCYTGAGWTFLDKSVVPLPETHQNALCSTVARGDSRSLVVYWYQVHSRSMVSKTRQVCGVLWRALLGYSTDSLVVSVSSPVLDSDTKPVSDDLVAFSELVMNALSELANNADGVKQ